VANKKKVIGFRLLRLPFSFLLLPWIAALEIRPIGLILTDPGSRHLKIAPGRPTPRALAH
jgi:hypothetical protein